MSTEALKGRVHSFQSLGTLDGPGVRFVVFTQGCNLRCGCCHNPDTWKMNEGTEYTAEEIVKRAVRYREYFKENGGVTVSGGEPLLQHKFVKEVCSHLDGIHKAIQTSGYADSDVFRQVIEKMDYVMMDIKLADRELHKKYTGVYNDKILKNFEILKNSGKDFIIRIPSFAKNLKVNGEAADTKDLKLAIKKGALILCDLRNSK